MPAATAAYMQADRPDIVIHAAGRVGGIQANMANPVAFLDVNPVDRAQCHHGRARGGTCRS